MSFVQNISEILCLQHCHGLLEWELGMVVRLVGVSIVAPLSVRPQSRHAIGFLVMAAQPIGHGPVILSAEVQASIN